MATSQRDHGRPQGKRRSGARDTNARDMRSRDTSARPQRPQTSDRVLTPRGAAREAAHRRVRRQRRNAVLAVIGLLLVSACAFGAYQYSKLATGLAPSADDAAAVSDVLDAVPSETASGTVEYILLLGVDARPGETRSRSDTIIIARVDTGSETVSLLSIPRDSRVEIEGHGLDKLGHANAYDGPPLTIQTVKALTGLPINHYVTVNFQGFADIVDAMGGIEIDVEQEINDSDGSNTGGVSDVTHIDTGVQTLNGAQALTFVRNRKYANGDFQRIKNQQTFLKALATQALQVDNVGNIPSMITAVSENVKTDMTIAQIMKLANAYRGFSGNSMKTYTIPATTGTIDGVSYVLPDEEGMAELIAAFRAGEEPTGTAE